MKNLFLYARKSTDVEDKQVLSIDAQVTELREFAAREGLKIVAELIEKQSAKSPGRPVFDAMLRRIEAGEADGILAWHPDRLARNSVDGGRIIYLLDTGKLKTLKFPRSWFENTPQGKLMLHNDFGFSKYYVDSLSENTKRGLREKVRRGEFPGPAPIGYLNDYRTKKLILDRERAPYIKQAFEMYATGKVTYDHVREFLDKHGFRTKAGKMLCRRHIGQIFWNPIYYGHFKYNGEVHEGKHEPIISKSLSDAVHFIMSDRFRWAPRESAAKRIPKAFMGLLRCGGCGGGITAEIQKGHVYYRCTKKNRVQRCTQPYVREEALDAEISTLLKPFELRSDWADAMLSRVKEEKKQSAQSTAKVIAEKRGGLQAINLRLQRLLDSFLDAVIERDEYTAEKTRLMSQKKTLEGQIAALSAGRADWLEPFTEWILTAKNAGKIVESGSLPEKRVLAFKVFGSNLVLDGKKARGSCVKPWSALVELNQTGGMVRAAGFEPATPTV